MTQRSVGMHSYVQKRHCYNNTSLLNKITHSACTCSSQNFYFLTVEDYLVCTCLFNSKFGFFRGVNSAFGNTNEYYSDL